MKSRARVFISCGQATDEERRIASDIASRLENAGFDPYVAVQQQSLRGLKESIFRQLEVSEYYLFVDLRREKIDGREDCRGSLFSHQELAIAAFRNIDVLALREDGVELNGVSRFIHENAIGFSDRRHLASLVADKVREIRWDPCWRNELTLIEDAPSSSSATRMDRDIQGNTHRYSAKFHHVHVTNRHRDKPAINCYAYLEEFLDLGTGKRSRPVTIEHKWAGYTYPNALIAAGTARAFDAFFVRKRTIQTGAANLIDFNVFADSTAYYPSFKKAGEYEFTYRVIAENFPSASATFRVNIADNSWDSTLTIAAD